VKIGIIGGGAWGTALGLVAVRRGHEVVLWAREAEVVTDINEKAENSRYLPGVALAPSIAATCDIGETLAGADCALLVAPAQHCRSVLRSASARLGDRVPLVLCAKGIEKSSLALMTEVAAEVAPRAPLAVLSGPTFAREVALGLPTAVTIAATEPGVAALVAGALGGGPFRPYLSDDPVGAEIGGAVKNVIAIACGIAAGRRLGDNARAALITRGLAEILRLGRAKGARMETLMGLAGLGDLTLTCTGPQSRNMSLGQAIGAGATLDQALSGKASVAEGVESSLSVTALAERLAVDMPICRAVAAILHHDANVDEVLASLLSRPVKSEIA